MADDIFTPPQVANQKVKDPLLGGGTIMHVTDNPRIYSIFDGR